jgi:uncharacterized membrane protein YhaH (DUF805 family)
MTRPRSTAEVLGATLVLYAKYPLLFAGLAAAVVVPYELIVLAATGTAPFGQQHTSAGTALTLVLIEFVIVGPLISALHVDAVAMIAEGQRPSLARVAAWGVKALPVVAAAQIVAGLAIALGFLALIVPGIVLALRFAVVAQTAAVEGSTWMEALRRSGQLARGNYWHILGLLVILALTNTAITRLGQAAAGTSTHPAPVVIGIVVETIVRSLTALATAVLYFDLRARNG